MPRRTVEERRRMSARKAYISSLGTTGLLVAAALAMLVVVGALVAFDRWPTQAIAEAESVPIARDGADSSRASTASRTLEPSRVALANPVPATRSRAVLQGAAARAGSTSTEAPASAPGARAPAASDPVVSDLPAPDSEPGGPAQQPAPAAASTPQVPSSPDPRPPVIELPPGSLEPTAGDGLTDATTSLGDSIGGFSPTLGETVRGTGATVTGSVQTLLGVN
jgi:hypothetical protein